MIKKRSQAGLAGIVQGLLRFFEPNGEKQAFKAAADFRSPEEKFVEAFKA